MHLKVNQSTAIFRNIDQSGISEMMQIAAHIFTNLLCFFFNFIITLILKFTFLSSNHNIFTCNVKDSSPVHIKSHSSAYWVANCGTQNHADGHADGRFCSFGWRTPLDKYLRWGCNCNTLLKSYFQIFSYKVFIKSVT